MGKIFGKQFQKNEKIKQKMEVPNIYKKRKKKNSVHPL
jgi:hypothetical protein